jgi:2-amino-4-hydroxy-6-hydroxymethyldihydropteridine diphosphokinase
VGLGANVGDAEAALAEAVRDLAALPGVRLRAVSPLYVTAPWGVTDQPDFRNAIVALDVPAGEDPDAGAIDLLRSLKAIERAAGRRERGRWGPRELDLDLLLFGRHRIRVERPPDTRSLDAEHDPQKAARLLEVPHRDAAQRLFVLAPLADIAPHLVPPGWSATVETMRRRIAAHEPPGSVRRLGGWDPLGPRFSRGAGSAGRRARRPR